MAETNEIRLMGGKLIVAGVGGYTEDESDKIRKAFAKELSWMASRENKDEETRDEAKAIMNDICFNSLARAWCTRAPATGSAASTGSPPQPRPRP